MADMKSTAPRFDVATLQSLAGDGFARGEAYWREGRVRRLVCAETRSRRSSTAARRIG